MAWLKTARELVPAIATFRIIGPDRSRLCLAVLTSATRGAGFVVELPLHFAARLLACGIAASVLLTNAPGAMANCVGGGGTTNCTGNPATFPSGGAVAVGTDTTLNANSLTANIVPSTGTPGAKLAITPGKASDGTSLPIHGTNGDSGSSSPDIAVNFQGAGPSFQANTTNATGIDAVSAGQAGGTGGTGFGALVVIVPVPGIGGNGGHGGSGGNVSVTTTGSGLISTNGTNAHAILGLSQGGAGGNGGNGDTFVSIGQGGDGRDGGAPQTVTIDNVLNLNTTGSGAAGIWAQSVGAAGERAARPMASTSPGSAATERRRRADRPSLSTAAATSRPRATRPLAYSRRASADFRARAVGRSACFRSAATQPAPAMAGLHQSPPREVRSIPQVRGRRRSMPKCRRWWWSGRFWRGPARFRCSRRHRRRGRQGVCQQRRDPGGRRQPGLRHIRAVDRRRRRHRRRQRRAGSDRWQWRRRQ